MSEERHVLIVEDEQKIADLVKDYLVQSGFSVTHINRGDKVVSFVKSNKTDLILLDIMLPGKDGMDVCREIRTFSEIPIVMLTAKADEIDRLIGLELGADDYICKPFSPREVVARVKTVLRRSQPSVQIDKSRIVNGDIELDEVQHKVFVKKSELKLTPTEFGVLKIMMQHPGRVYSRMELINAVQGYEFDGYDRTIDTHIKNLRKKLSGVMPGKDVISAVYGTGYRFNADEME